MADNSKRTGPAVEARSQFQTWLMPTVEKFPRSHKFTIGDRIEIAALDVLEMLIEAAYTKDRLQQLQQANPGIEKLRFLLRLAADLKLLDRPPLVVQLMSGADRSRRKSRAILGRLGSQNETARAVERCAQGGVWDRGECGNGTDRPV
jgi:hypothetical protein